MIGNDQKMDRQEETQARVSELGVISQPMKDRYKPSQS